MQSKNKIASEAQYYSLPYGGLGFFSHIYTYYTLTMLSLGKKRLHLGATYTRIERGRNGIWVVRLQLYCLQSYQHWELWFDVAMNGESFILQHLLHLC